MTEYATGTRAISTGTEYSLVTDTAGPDADTTEGCYQAFIDLSDMIAGDIVRISMYEKARSGDTQRKIDSAYLAGAQAQPMFVTPPLLLKNGWDITIEALAGTITVNWSIRKV